MAALDRYTYLSEQEISYINDFYNKYGKRHFAVDIASRVVQVCYYSFAHKKLINKQITPLQLKKILSEEFPGGSLIVVFEACGASNYWARFAQKCGHDYKCYMPSKVIYNRDSKNKTDFLDAIAILKTGLNPFNNHSVKCKTELHQLYSNLMTARTCIVKQKVICMNSLRALMYEHGVVLPRDISPPKAIKIAADYLETIVSREDADVDKESIASLFEITYKIYAEQLMHCVETIEEIDNKLMILSKDNEICQLLRTIPGVGYIVSMRLYIAGYNIGNFRNAKHFAGYCGIAPHVEGTGGSAVVKGVRHYGNRELAGLIYVGALGHYKNKLKEVMENSTNQTMINKLAKKRKILICSIANHIARTAYAVLRDRKPYVNIKASGLLTAYREAC